MNFLQTMIKATGNEYAAIAEEGITAGDITGWTDTGVYTLNALISGSIYGGFPSNKVVALAGDPGVGKTYIVISIIKQFLNDNPTGTVAFFEAESAISKEMLQSRGVDVSRVAIIPVSTVQEFRTQAMKILDAYKELKERPPLYMVLDSLGMLSTTKEMTDIAEGKDVQDMTRARLVKGTFRALTLILGKLNVPLLITNHVSVAIGSNSPEKVMTGGSGLQYAASIIVFISKSQDKDGDVRVGSILKFKVKKSRLTIEDKKVEANLRYDTGMSRYYGLLELAEKFGIFKKVSTRYEIPGVGNFYGKQINDEPERFFTKDVLDQIDAKCKEEFKFGNINTMLEKDEPKQVV